VRVDGTLRVGALRSCPMRNAANVRWRPRRAESPWLLAGGLGLAVIGVVLDRWHGPSWLLLAGGCVTAGAAVLLERRARSAATADERARQLHDASRALRPSGELRLVAEN
jgi:hypothetical protein